MLGAAGRGCAQPDCRTRPGDAGVYGRPTRRDDARRPGSSTGQLIRETTWLQRIAPRAARRGRGIPHALDARRGAPALDARRRCARALFDGAVPHSPPLALGRKTMGLSGGGGEHARLGARERGCAGYGAARGVRLAAHDRGRVRARPALSGRPPPAGEPGTTATATATTGRLTPPRRGPADAPSHTQPLRPPAHNALFGEYPPEGATRAPRRRLALSRCADGASAAAPRHCHSQAQPCALA